MNKKFSDLIKEFDLLYQFGSPLRYDKLNRGYEFKDIDAVRLQLKAAYLPDEYSVGYAHNPIE